MSGDTMRERRRTMGPRGAGAAAALLLGACTNADSAGRRLGGRRQRGRVRRPGDSTGVTDDTIKIGWPTIDQAALVEAGLATDFGDLTDARRRRSSTTGTPTAASTGARSSWSNRSFGTDIANILPDMQQVCLELTEDEKVFATVAFAWFGDAVTCLAGDHDTPLVIADVAVAARCSTPARTTSSWPTSLGGRPGAARSRRSTTSGELDDFEKIGVFGPLEPGMREAIDDGLAPALEDAGTEIAEDGTIPFSASPSTPPPSPRWSAASSPRTSTPSFAVGNFFLNGAFMTEAERQDYHPTYVMSDLVRGHRRPHLEVRARRPARPGHRGQLEGQVARPGADRRGPGVPRDLRARREGRDPAGRRRPDLRAPGPPAPGPRRCRRGRRPGVVHRGMEELGCLHHQRWRRTGAIGPTSTRCPTRCGWCGSTSTAASAGPPTVTGSTWMTDVSEDGGGSGRAGGARPRRGGASSRGPGPTGAEYTDDELMVVGDDE